MSTLIDTFLVSKDTEELWPESCVMDDSQEFQDLHAMRVSLDTIIRNYRCDFEEMELDRYINMYYRRIYLFSELED